MKIVRVPNSFPPTAGLGQKPITKKPVLKVKEIILPQDIDILNRFGPKQIRPNGARQPLSEIKIIAKVVMAVNNMSVFSNT